MKKLFISDLDGTLLNSEAKISVTTSEIINSYIKKGMFFTFATARSIYSAKKITEKLNINIPCILMNGVSIYDIQNDKYIKNEYIGKSVSEKIISAFNKHGLNCFMYKIHENILKAYFTEMTSEIMKKFAEERKNKFQKPFIQCSEFKPDSDIVYFTLSDEYDILLPLKNDISKIEGSDFAFYKDTYTGKWYLEIFSKNASKANGIKFLRNKYCFDYITSFGDNHNDLPMFKESDYCVAVKNAAEDVIKSADFIANYNNSDGVAKWIADNFDKVYYIRKDLNK